MKNKSIYLIFSFLLLLSKLVVAQFNITDGITCNQINKIYSPTLDIIYGGVFNSRYPKYDINNDGVDDFEIKGIEHYSPNYSEFEVYITPLGQNEIALRSIDTLMESYNNGTPTSTSYTFAVPQYFSLYDTIKTTQIWQNASMYFEYRHIQFNWTRYLNNYLPYNNRIIGVRLISSTDTIYGWIKFYSSSPGAIRISEIVYERKKPISFSISPNPFTNNVFVNVDCNAMIGSKWELYDQLGQVVLNGVFESTSNMIELDRLSSSLYFLKTEFSTSKIIKINP